MGNLVQAGAPMGPDARSWYSALFSLGTNFDSVIPFGPYLEDDQDLEDEFDSLNAPYERQIGKRPSIHKKK